MEVIKIDSGEEGESKIITKERHWFFWFREVEYRGFSKFWHYRKTGKLASPGKCGRIVHAAALYNWERGERSIHGMNC